jgi:hypothetical protein
VVDSLKALDPNRPIREADIGSVLSDVRFVPEAEVAVIITMEVVQRDAHNVVGEMDMGPIKRPKKAKRSRSERSEVSSSDFRRARRYRRALHRLFVWTVFLGSTPSREREAPTIVNGHQTQAKAKERADDCCGSRRNVQ